MKTRLTLMYIAEVIVLLTLMLTNPRHHIGEQFDRIHAHLLLGVFLVILATAIAVRDVYIDLAYPKWAVWQWAHPVTILSITAMYAAGSYFIALYFGFSGRFDVPPAVFTVLRRVGYAVGFIGTPIAIEILTFGIIDRWVTGKRSTRPKYTRYS